MGRSMVMILPLFVVILSVAMCFVSVDSTMRLELKKPMRSLGEILQNDMKRQKMISLRRSRNHHGRNTLETSGGIEMELHPGRDYGTGSYLTELDVGTPSQKFTMVVDTGSELTWVSCRYRCGGPGGKACTAGRGANRRRRAFNPRLSSSFRTVPCLSPTCTIDLMNLFSLSTCPTPLNPCAYDYRYHNSSLSDFQ